MNTLRILAISALAASLAACASTGSSAAANVENPIIHHVSDADRAHAQSTEPLQGAAALLWVNGMGCPLCATNLDRQLIRLKNVQSVTVDMSVGTALVQFSGKGTNPSPARMGDAVKDAGFTLVKVEAR